MKICCRWRHRRGGGTTCAAVGALQEMHKGEVLKATAHIALCGGGASDQHLDVVHSRGACHDSNAAGLHVYAVNLWTALRDLHVWSNVL